MTMRRREFLAPTGTAAVALRPLGLPAAAALLSRTPMYGLIGKVTAAPGQRDAIARGRSLIAGFSNRVETTPLGGHGLSGS